MVLNLSCMACLLYLGFAMLFLKYILPLVQILFNYTVGKNLFGRRKYLRDAGEWAIVTGATDGIGKAYARELAKDGLKIMLISRSVEKLEATAKEIESDFGVQTKTVCVDFTRDDIYDTVDSEISKLSSIGCLVNNVGMSYPRFEYFAEADFTNFDFIRKLITCNMNSVACMTRIVLPKLLKQGKPGAAIINLSSASGLYPNPFLSLYAASKAFVLHLGRTLTCELSHSHVIIQTVCPSLVATSMTKVKRPSYFIPSPESYVSSALDMLGVEEVTSGYFSHAIQIFLATNSPTFLTRSYFLNFVKRGRAKLK